MHTLVSALPNVQRYFASTSGSPEAIHGRRYVGHRVAWFGARKRYLAERRSRQPHPADRALAHLRRLAEVVAGNGVVTALDTGMQDGRYLDEIGVSTWTAGRTVTVTYAAEDAAYRNPDDAIRVMNHPRQVHVRALFGETRLVPRDALKGIASKAARDADLVVFHQASSDLMNLDLMVEDRRIIDTALIGQALLRPANSLVDLCRHLGIPAVGNHNSGNDARYALDVAMAMLDRGVVELRRKSEANAAKDLALRDAMMWPTTKIGATEALRRFEDACLLVPPTTLTPGSRGWLRSWDALLPRIMRGADDLLIAHRSCSPRDVSRR